MPPYPVSGLSFEGSRDATVERAPGRMQRADGRAQRAPCRTGGQGGGRRSMSRNESFSLPRSSRGQALVEMAIVLTVLLLLLTGIIEFGRVLSAQLIVSHASREGARIGVLGKTDAEITQRVLDAASALDASKITVDITPPQSERVRGVELRVEVKYLVDIVVPLLSDILTNPYPVRGVTVMRVE